jgi:hypothetical protein
VRDRGIEEFSTNPSRQARSQVGDLLYEKPTCEQPSSSKHAAKSIKPFCILITILSQ